MQALDQAQADLSYQHAQSSLARLLGKLDLTARERTGLEDHIQSLEHMLHKLETDRVHIAVFGMVSRGKSSLLNALLGQTIFATGPTHGVTRQTQRASWEPAHQVEAPGEMPLWRYCLPGQGQSQIELIDTPGIDEVDGEAREQLATQVAQQADLILFIVAGDMTRVEYEALSALRGHSKPILLVFNKIDQYPEVDRQAIYKKIRDDRVKELLSPDEIVMAAAAPLVAQAVQHRDGSVSAELVPGPPQIEDLKLKILEVLDREGKALVALNTMLFADDVQERVITRKLQIRDRNAGQVIWRSAMSKAIATAINPVAIVDVMSSLVIDVAMILTLSKLYGLPMTRQGALLLLRNIAIAMGGVSLTELLATLGLGSLKGVLGLAAPATGGVSLVPYASVAMTQAAVAGVSSYAIGQIAKEYLVRGACWGEHSPKAVVSEILSTLDQTSILNRIKTELRQKITPRARL
ncbi:GTP-binding protein [Lyngbya confervoides BDU141951]|uniref:GTP-binding protein n=1 Tax=Lyngbya confervoides BDU141951 TaxID=1574623 RepID=A0ABD4SY45_9CYAN|nr:GTP-binding protein [Lyngbya confervoides]MCM1981318.1 GTP-binding protein [Lyngbya confervoides BDU141951]